MAQEVLSFTKILDGFSCKYSSKLLSIGEEEHYWKATKRNNHGQKVTLGVQLKKKKSAVSVGCCHELSSLMHVIARTAGKLYDDVEFETIAGK